MLKKIVPIAAIVYTIILAFACLVKPENIPDIDVSYGDKIFHFLAYFVLTFLWFGTFIYNFYLKKRKAIIYAAILSIVFGILIEVLQETITDSRRLDIYDVIANTFGVIIAVLVLVLKKNIDVKKI